MIKYKIGKGEIVIHYCPYGDMWANINTKALQGSLFYNMHGCLMGIGEYYDDDIESLNANPDLLPSQECKDNVSAEDASVLAKAQAIVKVLDVAHNSFPSATKKNQAAVAALLLTRTTSRQTRASSSHYRSVLGHKVKALCTGDTGTRTDERGLKLRRLMDRQTG